MGAFFETQCRWHNNTFRKAAFKMQVRSNRNSFQVLYYKIAADNLSLLEIILYPCRGNGQFYEPALCQLYWHFRSYMYVHRVELLSQCCLWCFYWEDYWITIVEVQLCSTACFWTKIIPRIITSKDQCIPNAMMDHKHHQNVWLCIHTFVYTH